MNNYIKGQIHTLKRIKRGIFVSLSALDKWAEKEIKRLQKEDKKHIVVYDAKKGAAFCTRCGKEICSDKYLLGKEGNCVKTGKKKFRR